MNFRDAPTPLTATSYNQIFTLEDIASQYRTLAKIYHPDVSTGSVESFQKLNTFYKDAQEARISGYYKIGHGLFFGGKYIQDFQWESIFELGNIYQGGNKITFVLDASKASLVQRKISITPTVIRPEIRDKMKPLLPIEVETNHTKELVAFTYGKTEDQILLDTLLQHQLFSESAAGWLVSCLLNLGSYFQLIEKFIPLDISRYTLLVSPKHHSVAFTGDFWYGIIEGSAVTYLPSRSLDSFPKRVTIDKVAKYSDYVTQVKHLVAESLGDRQFTKLKGKISPAFYNWLTVPSCSTPFEEYESWEKQHIHNIFGKRKFVVWDIDLTFPS